MNVESVTRAGTNTPVQLSGTTTSNSGAYQNDGNTAAKATDGNVNTYFDAAQASGAYVQVDLGTPESVDEIRYAPRSGFASRMVGGVSRPATRPRSPGPSPSTPWPPRRRPGR